MMPPKTDEEIAMAHTYNPAIWVIDNHVINENQKPFEFTKHRFMLQPYSDSSPDQVIMKSAQVGWSVAAILKSVHAAYYLKFNVIYVLPTRNASAEFVVPKVNPMLKRNPVLAAMVRNTDNKSLKEVGDRWIYFKGAHHEGEAISTSADLIISDENDRSDQSVLTIYQSRLQASDYAGFWRFSNPSIPGFGVHEWWQESDQMHWMVRCHHCGHVSYMGFEPDSHIKNHYVDEEQVIYACGKCGKVISNDDRQDGFWYARKPSLGPKPDGTGRRGYWISQMMVPWVSAANILKQKKSMSIDVFHNFVLGLPYQASEYMLNRDAFKRACHPGLADKREVIMGVDSGKDKHYIIGNMEGVFNYGKTTSWEDIERLILLFNATCVIDAYPDFTPAEQLARKYPGQVFVHEYLHDAKGMDVTGRKEGKDFGVLQSDRTKLFDLLAAKVTNQHMRFYQPFSELDDLVYHAGNMYRILKTDTRGIEKAFWETKENKPDHWAHALAYYLVGVQQALTSEEVGGVRTNPPVVKGPRAIQVNPIDNTVAVKEALGMDMDKLIEKSIRRSKKRRIQ